MRHVRSIAAVGLCALGLVHFTTQTPLAKAEETPPVVTATPARPLATSLFELWVRWRVSLLAQPQPTPEPEPETPSEPQAEGTCSDPNGLRLPDIFVDPSNLADNHLSTSCDGLAGVERCLRVSVGTVNAGEGDLILTAPVGQQDQISEHITSCSGGEVLQPVHSAFVDEPSHQHLHLQDWTELRLRKIDASCEDDATATQCPIVGLGHKVSFCLMDTGRYDSVLGRYGGRLGCGVDQGGARIVQGISSGWMDVYTSNLPGQLIDVSQLESGDYWLEVEVNPHRAVIESNYENNITRIRISLAMPVCGDGTLSPVEQCDASSNAALPPCATLGEGFVAGQAACTSCKFDTSACERATCPMQSLGSAIGDAVASGPAPTTANAFIAESCENPAIGTGSEATYGWTAPRTGTFAFDTLGSTYDTVLYLRGPSCEAMPNIRTICNDDITDPASPSSRVTLRMQQGETVTVVVDAYSPGAAGQMVLNISEQSDPLATTAPVVPATHEEAPHVD